MDIPLPPAVQEAARMIQELEQAGCIARLFGSCAVWLRCKSYRPVLAALSRIPKDIDLVMESPSVPSAIQVLTDRGWIQDEQLRAWTEGNRLRFRRAAGDQTIDVCVDQLRFAQKLDLRGRISRFELCISPTDLMLSKLQIVDKTRNDVIDAVAILASHSIGVNEEQHLSSARVEYILRHSWRWKAALEHARSESEKWSDVAPDCTEFDASVGLSRRTFAELLSAARDRRHAASWYYEALVGRLTGAWFDAVELP